ncbi:receptor-like protein 13 [Elaeis guineensis]|uniref:receptor-like protein 13 n=1 Tax=Elaeis guineensis var. tenera TaxID=51953 RepID=UPI003C6D54FD
MLDLSGNILSGSLPNCFQSSGPQLLNLAENVITGTIPTSYFNTSYFATLDVSNNQLSSKLPKLIGDHVSLEILVLSGNSFEGPTPIELCKLQSLHILDLSQSNLSGSIPSCLGKMHFRKADSSHLDPLYYIYWMDPHHHVRVEVDLYAITLVDLITKGNLYTYATDHLLLMSAIDFSANKIESLDISHNQLSGVIPGQLTQLTSLESFSVAYNNLSGCTPEFKNQFATFNVSSYEGNIGLHGPPLEKTCTSDSSPTIEVKEHQDDSSVDDAIFFAIVAATFVAGLWGCIAFLSFHHIGQHIRIILDGYVDSLT